MLMDREKVVDRAGDPDARRGQHDHVVADTFEVADKMGRQHDADVSFGDHFADAVEELSSGERVEAGDWFIEDQQLGPLRDGHGEGELRTLPTRQLSGPAAPVEAELGDSPFGEIAIPSRVEPRAEPEMIIDAQIGVRRGVLGDEPDPSDLRRVGGRRSTEHLHVAGVGCDEPDREAHQGGLAGPVRADEPDDAPGRNRDSTIRERPAAPVSFAEAVGRQHHVVCHGHQLYEAVGHSPVTAVVTGM